MSFTLKAAVVYLPIIFSIAHVASHFVLGDLLVNGSFFGFFNQPDLKTWISANPIITNYVSFKIQLNCTQQIKKLDRPQLFLAKLFNT